MHQNRLGPRGLGVLAMALFLAGAISCGTGPERESIATTLALSDTLVAPGDSLSGVLCFANNGRAPHEFVSSCPRFWIQVVDSVGEDLNMFSFPCPAVPTGLVEGEGTWVLRAGETVTVPFWFRAEFYDRRGLLVPCPAGTYTVSAGLRWPAQQYPWAHRAFTVSTH